MKHTIVSVAWLNEHLDDRDLILLDVSPKSTVSGTVSPHQEWSIPKSRYVDLKGRFTKKESPFPNTVPDKEHFQNECQQLGINQNSMLVVYDNLGIYTSPRLWWLFKIMGHEKVVVLDGGLPEWIAKECEVVQKDHLSTDFTKGDFKANFHKQLVKTYEDILNNVVDKSFQIVDARSAGRFNGTAPEPRKHLQSGCIPNSVNIPFKSVLDNGKFKSTEELKKIFEKQNDGSKDLVFSCGSGLTACIILLASEIAFKNSRYVYDGSWTEWAELQDLKQSSKNEDIVQGQAEAYNNRDLEKFCSYFSEDIQLFNYQDENPTLIGKKALIISYKDVFENSPELDAKIINRIVFDNKVIDHEQVTGRKGIAFIDIVVIYELKDNLINKVTYLKRTS